MVSESKKRGRPTKYKPEYVKQAKKLCGLGATTEQLADFFGVCVDTITEWMNVYPSFSAAIKNAKDQYDRQVVGSLLKKALGFTRKVKKTRVDKESGMPVAVEVEEYYPPDTTACIFWLKNRQKKDWRDKHEVEVEVPQGVAVSLVDGPPQETYEQWLERKQREREAK